MTRNAFRMHIRRAAMTAVVAAGCCAVAPNAAAEDAGAAIPTFFEPLRVDLVMVEAVVTDRSGAPISGLTPDDFEVFEDGKPVEITHFRAADPPDNTDPAGAARPGGEVYLSLYIDDTNVDPQLRTSVLARLGEAFGGPMPPNMSTMLVRFDGALHIESDFAATGDELIAAIGRMRGRPPMDPSREGEALVRRMQSLADRPRLDIRPPTTGAPGGGQPVVAQDPFDVDPESYSFIPEIHQYARSAHLRHRASLDALGRFMGVLGAMPGRKVMIWVGSLETRTGENLFRTWQDLFPGAARRRGLDPMMESLQYDLTSELSRLLDEASRDRISISPIGLLSGGGRNTASSNARIFETAGRPGSRGHVDERSRDATLALMASMTGGRLLANNARLVEELAQVVEGLGSFYSLAYQSPSTGDGEYHSITVKLRRDDALIRHREGYRASGEALRASDRTLAAAMLGAGANPLGISATCEAQEARADGDFMVPVAVSVPLGGLVLLPEGEQHTAQITVLSVVRDLRGGVSEVHERAYPIEIGNDQLVAAVEQRATFVLGMVLRPGPHRIAVGVRDERSAVESTVFVDVAVGAEAGGSPE